MNIHIIMQGKGGVGKSFVAYLLCQYFNSLGNTILPIDTDPNNATLTAFKNLNVTHLEIYNDEKEVDPSKFDKLIETIADNNCDDCIIDTGASNFQPFANYLINNEVLPMLVEMGHKVYIHTVIIGGQSLNDTMIGLKSICRSFNTDIVVWFNSMFGNIADNKTFYDTIVYTENKEKIRGVVTLPKIKNEFEADLNSLLKKHLTFDEGVETPEFRLMQKQRIKNIKRDYFNLINNSLVGLE